MSAPNAIALSLTVLPFIWIFYALIRASLKPPPEPEPDPLAELVANLPERTPRQKALDGLVKIIEDEDESWDGRRMAAFWHQEVTNTGDLERAQQFLDSYYGGCDNLLMGVRMRPIPHRYERPLF
ncbi:MAG: hypothetical protein KTV68_05635 [Acidimicrobiia bacterium]|nr:hypothetical protein [Acidimicrobiia bacterium]MCY4433415.1 hypothetical protein [bacterium]